MMSSLRLIASGFKPENVSGNFVTILDVFDRIESSNHTKSDS
jgi:hypothetical protein